jgi:hypothetical protein
LQLGKEELQGFLGFTPNRSTSTVAAAGNWVDLNHPVQKSQSTLMEAQSLAKRVNSRV